MTQAVLLDLQFIMTDALDAVQAERSPGPSTQGSPQPQHTEGYRYTRMFPDTKT